MGQLDNMIEKVKKIKGGIGIQSLLDAAYGILGNPIAIFDTEYKLMNYTEVVTDDPIWNELITIGTFSKETQKFFENEGFIEDVANAKIALLKSPKLKYDRINGKIFNKNNSQVANLIFVATNRPFEKEDQMVFEIICKLVSKEISRIEFYQEYEQAHQEVIIKNLIDGNYDKRLDMGQVGIIYDSLGPNLYIAVADISLCSSEYDIVFFRDLLKQIKSTYKYAIYSKYIVIIISTSNESLNGNKDLNELIKAFEKYNIYAGISSRFENLFELQKYYRQALTVLQYTLEVKSSQRIFPCNHESFDTMERINELENDKGIQYFLNKGPEIFGNPLLFHDMELNLLAYTENIEIIDPIWEELITYGTSSDETINLFKTEGYVSIMENTKGGSILISDKIKYDRISWRIYSKDNIMIGCLSIVNTDKQFTEDTLMLFGAFSQKFSKEVSKIEFYNNYGQLYSGTVINRLISGKIDDYTFYSENIGNLYNSLMENIYLLVIDTTKCDERINLTYCRELFNEPNTVKRYTIYSNYIIIIISTDSASVNKNNEFDKISKAFEIDNVYAGLSSQFDNIYDLQKHYNEAVHALETGLKNNKKNGKQRIFRYEEIDKLDVY